MINNRFKLPITVVFSMLTLFSYGQNSKTISSAKTAKAMKKENGCSETCTAKNRSKEMACKLTTPQLRQRKETVIASLKQQIIEKKELDNGFAFKFPGTDKVVDELAEFIKTERACCDFFTFTLSVSGDQSEAWLSLTGDEGVKAFIVSELGL